MQFNSFNFLCFFPVVLLVYFFIPKKARHVWLLLASYYFYMSWNASYALLIGFSTLATYLAGVFIDKENEGENRVSKKKAILILCLVVNLAILFFFKYFDFAVDNINFVLGGFGKQINPKFDVLLPVGISFYTFQALGYIIDVYRADVKAEKNIIRYALFVSFFPQLVAGPIERSKNLLSELDGLKTKNLWDYKRITEGAMVMLWGFFMKMVIADRVSIFVDAVYEKYWMYGTVELALATIFFMFQIYCDFGGYSLIAIGSAKIMGVDLMENFRAPFFAVSIKDFWGRWHISLTSWFRDYVYFPLGGSRKGKVRKYINNLIVFLLSGLWHGAAWTYAIWGMLLGLFQIIGELLDPVKKWISDKTKVNKKALSHKLICIVFTFMLVCTASVFFRATNVKEAFEILGRIVTRPNFWVLFDESLFSFGFGVKEFRVTIVALVILFLVDLVREIKNQKIEEFLSEQNLWFRWLVLIVLFVFCVVFGVYGMGYDAGQFIYFRF